MHKYIWMVMISLALAVNGAFAGNSWLDQGSKLLKDVSGSGSSDSKSSSSSSISGLTTSEITAGLKEALGKSAKAVVKQVSKADGYYKDSNIHIPLPDSLSTAKSLLDKAGFESYTEDLELKLNRAAEAAAPKAKKLFVNAVKQMKIEDAKEILNGADDAATEYFKEKMSDDLTESMTPIVEKTLGSVGAIKSYDNMISKYKTLPFVPDVKGNLTEYGTEKAIEGIFYYLAKEEKAIRENPAKRTTELLKKVFN